jgi:phosphopantetheine binding protein/AMP-binding enzyme
MGNMDEAREQRMRAQLQAIEARLAEHPQVAAVAAAVRDDRLIAYVVFRSGQAPDDDALRAHLKTALPAYMIPRHFMALDALPLAVDGSVDHDALPQLQSVSPAAQAVASRDDQDSRTAYLAGVWTQLLGRDAGANDNFFDLGGHSMLAVQMANRVKADTGVRIQLMTLASQTLAQIAAELPATAKSTSPGFGARIVGNLKGILRGAGAAGQP